MSPTDAEVVLVRPARPGNVAAACRAMKNMGLGTLRLVAPPPGLAEPDARSLAYGAWDVMDSAVVHESLRDAVAASTFVVGTSGRPSVEAWSPRYLSAVAEERAAGGRLSLVFGPEATGLTNEELALCHARVHIPTSSAHSSLNLAQAVLIVGYEIFLAKSATKVLTSPPRAAAGEIEDALDDLREGLIGIGYLNTANPEAILAEFRALLARAGPTSREIALLRGLARQIAWAAQRIQRPGG